MGLHHRLIRFTPQSSSGSVYRLLNFDGQFIAHASVPYHRPAWISARRIGVARSDGARCGSNGDRAIGRLPAVKSSLLRSPQTDGALNRGHSVWPDPCPRAPCRRGCAQCCNTGECARTDILWPAVHESIPDAPVCSQHPPVVSQSCDWRHWHARLWLWHFERSVALRLHCVVLCAIRTDVSLSPPLLPARARCALHSHCSVWDSTSAQPAPRNRVAGCPYACVKTYVR